MSMIDLSVGPDAVRPARRSTPSWPRPRSGTFQVAVERAVVLWSALCNNVISFLADVIMV